MKKRSLPGWFTAEYDIFLAEDQIGKIIEMKFKTKKLQEDKRKKGKLENERVKLGIKSLGTY